MRFPVVSLHEAHCPLSQIDWCPLGGLNERVAFLGDPKLVRAVQLERSHNTHVKLLWCGSVIRVLHQTLLDHVL